MDFLKPFKAIGHGIGHIFSAIFAHFTLKDAENALGRVGALAGLALPVVELVVKATPTQADDLLLEAAKGLGNSVEDIFVSTNELIHDGGRQRLAAEALRLKLIDMVKAGGHIDIGDFTLQTVDDVLALDKTTLITAVQNAVYLLSLIHI